jgi:hypothetical protein
MKRDIAGRVANRAKRELVARLPPVQSLVQQRYSARLYRHGSRLPNLQPEDHCVLSALRAEGVALTTLDDLSLAGTDLLQQALARHVSTLKGRPPDGKNVLRPGWDALLADAEVWQWWLTDRLLGIVENYLGLPVRYYGPDVCREVANGRTDHVRQWHRDVEDHRQLKLLIWLDDVETFGGPYEYIPVSRTAHVMQALRYVSGFVSETDMMRVVPRRERRQCLRPAWTAVLTDPASVFHRINPPASQDRYSLTFSCTSHHLIKKVRVPPMAIEQRARIQGGLSHRQLGCLHPAWR